MLQGGEFDHCWLLFLMDAKQHYEAAVPVGVGEAALGGDVPERALVSFLDWSRVAMHAAGEVHVNFAARG